jgi:hypothetical protein
MKISRRSLLTAIAVAPLGYPPRARSPAQVAAARSRAIAVTPQNDLGWVDAASREPLLGPRLPLPGWWALAVSWDRSAVLLRSYASQPFLLATSDTLRFDQSKPFQEGVSSVKGAVMAWPDKHRLMVAKDEAYGLPHGLTGIEIVDPTRGRVAARRELAAHLAGAASGRRGLVLALSTDAGGGARPTLALVEWSARIRSFPLTGLEFDNEPSGQEPAAGVALSPDEHTALIGSSRGLAAIELATGNQHDFSAPRGVVIRLEWLDSRRAVVVTEPDMTSADAARIWLLDTRTGRRELVGESASTIATGPGRIAFTPSRGGITTLTAHGAHLSHHAGSTPLSMLYPQTPGPYIMAVPGPVELHAGRRLAIDLRNGALALDKHFDHAPSDAVSLAG